MSPEPITNPTAANEDRAVRMTQALQRFSEHEMTAVLAAVAGYRVRCMGAGFTVSGAEEMCRQYHWFLIETMHREKVTPA